MRKIKPKADGPKIHCLYDQLVDPKTLNYHPKNRNKHPKDQIERLAKILEYQGWRYPIKVSKLSGCVTSGHGRIAAAFLKKWNQVPVVFQEYENAEQEYADVQSDNAIASWAELDLAAINLDIPDIGPDFDIDLLGIKDFTIDAADKYADKDADEVPEVKETDIKLGDLFILGNHRLLCGDATKKEDVDRLMNSQKADMVYTDPPYGVQYDESWREVSSNHFGGSTKGQIANDDRADWKETFLLFQAPIAYIWHASSMAHVVRQSLIESNYDVRQQIIWRKPFGVLSRQAYNRQHEVCYYCVLKGKTANWIGDKKQTTVWDAENPNHCMSKMGDGDAKTGHPTMKPVKLAMIAIQNHSGEIICDPFLGSGSTLIACEKTNRKCFGMEIDPHYCQVIIDRWEKFTGQKATKA